MTHRAEWMRWRVSVPALIGLVSLPKALYGRDGGEPSSFKLFNVIRLRNASIDRVRKGMTATGKAVSPPQNGSFSAGQP